MLLEVFIGKAAPSCDKKNCFAYQDGRCIALASNRFKRECPFFKDKKEKEIEDIRCEARVKKWKDNGKRRFV